MFDDNTRFALASARRLVDALDLALADPGRAGDLADLLFYCSDTLPDDLAALQSILEIVESCR